MTVEPAAEAEPPVTTVKLTRGKKAEAAVEAAPEPTSSASPFKARGDRSRRAGKVAGPVKASPVEKTAPKKGRLCFSSHICTKFVAYPWLILDRSLMIG